MIYATRIIGAYDLTQIFTWINIVYVVNPDMRSQTEGCIPMGMGTIHGTNGKQLLNMRDSTKAELVENSDYLSYNLGLIMLIVEQGYRIRDSLLFITK